MKAMKASIEDGNGSDHKRYELRSDTSHGFKFYSGSSVTNDMRELHSTVGHWKSKADDFQDQKRKGVNSDKESMETDNSSEKRNKQNRQCEFLSHEWETTQKNGNEAKCSYALDTMWTNVCEVELQITELGEENLKQVAELIRRNDEKRETIKRLQGQLEELRRENTLLRFSVRHSYADAESNEAYISRPRRIAFLFRGCSP